ncbi:MAG TPA: NADP-dependent oxidoreductase [Myxococcaceae bacterium]|nr:NADP-dependent oxidoreductase [Myxococcaceae bacterium]
MQESLPKEMRAVVIDRYGGPEVLHVATLPVPEPKSGQVLIRVAAAGIGVWDADVRAGEWEIGPRRFPKVIGNDAAGEVLATGSGVKRVKVGDRAYAYATDGGCYAEFLAVDEDRVAQVPAGLDVEAAGALGADGITGLVGLEDTLHLKRGEKVLIFGASGGIGHLVVQLAKRLEAHVFAVASGEDGVALVRRLGADQAVDGKHGAVVDALRSFAPDGLDAALVLAGGRGRDAALAQLKKDGRIAWPKGVEPEPEAPKGVVARSYDGEPSAKRFDRLDELISRGAFHVEARFYPLEEAAQAHRDLEKHHLGKLALRMR